MLLSRFAWVGVMFFVGARLTRAWGRPLLALVVLFGIAQSAIAERISFVPFLDGFTPFFTSEITFEAWIALVPWPQLFGIGVWLALGYLAALRGVNLGHNLRDRDALRGLIGAGALWVALALLPPALIGVGVSQGVVAPDVAANLMPVTDTRLWGGLLLTMLLTIVAITASFPLGVLLALGRRSSLPVVRWTCTAYIELLRGVPLITVLFMAQLLVPLVDPSLAEVDNVFRAMVGLTLFSAAYLAENVRGGLQSVPPGQVEAARAIGFNSVQVTWFILLPQALRAVIPALVGQFIALFKDTSLVALVGLNDLTGSAQAVIAQAEFIGRQTEVYIFISIVYFIFSYAMAVVSRRLEASGSGASREYL
ncbi:MAG: amino acid ABC transporter permease [Chloroflexi bacterium]|nr:amino acid ABC transporter permease [Chloroflexota bacterium]